MGDAGRSGRAQPCMLAASFAKPRVLPVMPAPPERRRAGGRQPQANKPRQRSSFGTLAQNRGGSMTQRRGYFSRPSRPSKVLSSRLCLPIAHCAIWAAPTSANRPAAAVCVATVKPTQPRISAAGGEGGGEAGGGGSRAASVRQGGWPMGSRAPATPRLHRQAKHASQASQQRCMRPLPRTRVVGAGDEVEEEASGDDIALGARGPQVGQDDVAPAVRGRTQGETGGGLRVPGRRPAAPERCRRPSTPSQPCTQAHT